jgi:hypothetical protein
MAKSHGVGESGQEATIFYVFLGKNPAPKVAMRVSTEEGSCREGEAPAEPVKRAARQEPRPPRMPLRFGGNLTLRMSGCHFDLAAL